MASPFPFVPRGWLAAALVCFFAVALGLPLLPLVACLLGVACVFLPTFLTLGRALAADWDLVRAVFAGKGEAGTFQDIAENAKLIDWEHSSSQSSTAELTAAKKQEAHPSHASYAPLSVGPHGAQASNTGSLSDPNSPVRQVVVVIPALNEALALPATLDRLRSLDPPVSLVVVADGGSTDSTVRLAQEGGAVVVESRKRGRGNQMNAGAQEVARHMNLGSKFTLDGRTAPELQTSKGGAHKTDNIICFLHADTIVPRDLVSVVRARLADKSTCCAGFVALLANPGQVCWSVTVQNIGKTWFCAFFQNPRRFFRGLRHLYGDQGICCRAEDFFQVGGYNGRYPIMEDADLCERLHRAASFRVERPLVALIPRLLVASGRRFKGSWTSLKQSLINWQFVYAYFKRASPDELRAMCLKMYRDKR